MLLLTGIKVGHSTHHRKVQQIENLLPEMKQGLSEIAIDGGTIKLRGEQLTGSTAKNGAYQYFTAISA
jgi:hypothetical protein